MMVFQPSGTNTTLLCIEAVDYKLYITGKLDNKKFRTINANLNMEAHLYVDSTSEVLVKTTDDFGELHENNSNCMRPCFFEEDVYQIILENTGNDKLYLYHNDKTIQDSIIAIGRNYYGSFSFNGDIGYSTFLLKKENEIILSLTIEVFPSKVDYIKDYKEMLNEVNEEISSLVFSFLSKTFSLADLKDVTRQTGVEFIEILNKLYYDLERALVLIENQPKHGVVNSEGIKKIDKVKRTSKNNISYLRKHTNLLQLHEYGFIRITSKNYIPIKAIEVKKTTTYDIYENQYLKHIIKNILHRIINIKYNVLKLYGSENNYFKVLNAIESKINKHLKGFFSNISDLNGKRSMSLVFKMSRGYKQVYYYYILLKKGLDISEGLYNITHKKLWDLYEIWCFLKLHKLLNELGFETISTGIIEITDNGITLSLAKNKESKMTYSNQVGKSIELWYNKVYPHLPTTTQKPDYVLCIRNKEKQDRVYIFDAKYRLAVDDYGIIGPMEEDINVMHRYRDAIVSELDESFQFKYNSFGAYVMFPYSNEEDFKKHRYYKSIEKVNIGAFPMLPGCTSLIKNHLRNLVFESYIEATNKLPVYEVDNDYVKFKNINVMVVNIANNDHLQAYLSHSFFHIPARRLYNVRLGVEYIAFYQPRTSFKDNSGIYFYGKIKDIKRYKRKECLDLPVLKNNGEEEYLRFELTELRPVGPISTVEYGVELLFYTTLYLLTNAETIHELHFRNRLEVELYKILKKVSLEMKVRITRRQNYFYVGKVKVEILNSKTLRVNDEAVKWEEIQPIIERSLIDT